ncbi:MAG: hypothetical protein QOF51_235 [Chloroflexota bacterium]|jgi:hypothetical protein|nr:hypothetical protein [Chloroflexota bacterium]
MAGPRVRRAPTGQESAAPWIAAIHEGDSPGALTAQVLASDNAPAAVRALGVAAGADAVPLLVDLARSAPHEVAIAAAEALGDVRDPAAAMALDELGRTATDKNVQKAARRSLYRLASQGIKPAATAPRAPAQLGGREATLYRAVASSYDGNGTRALWIGAERSLGGIYLIALEMNDVHGLTDAVGRDTTRKRFAEQERSMREKDIAAWVELPLEYARQLVQEGVTLARESGGGVPPSFAPWAEMIGEPAEPLARALVYEEINAFEARMHPTLENETPQLFIQPEVESWFFRPERVRKYLRQLAEPAGSRLIITPESDAERQQRIYREAIKDLLPTRELHGLRRRLEETAYIFLRTDREADARRAVAAAATIEDERPLRPIHPFLRALLDRSLDIAAEVERSGFEPMSLGRAP